MSSRVIVKNLPKQTSKEQLLSHVRSTVPGVDVTDCNLKYTKDGVFRRFAFVGFNTNVDAAKTQQKLDGTFIRTSKIQVALAGEIGDKSIVARSKYTQSARDKAKVKDGTKKDPEKPPDSDTKPLKPNCVIKMKGLPGFFTEKTVTDFFKPLIPAKIRIPRNAQRKPMGTAFVEFGSDKDTEQAMGRNKNFISGKKIMLQKSSEAPAAAKTAQAPAPWEVKAKESSQQVESIEESGRLFVRNLWFGVTESDIETMFGKFGPLAEVTVPVDPLTKKVKGFAHVEFVFPEHALKAYTELDYTSFHGRLVHILPGQDRQKDDASQENSSFKKKKDQKQKANASSAHNWNTLFLGLNAIADTMAKKYGTDKSNILDSDGKGSVGVRVALGETQIVAETRDFLIEQGLALDAFSQASGERSKTCILVKNLPSGVSGDELRDVFSKHGTVARLVMPPSGITAVVEFLEPSEARQAFLKLNFSKFRSIPLYLEWAPVGVFSKPPPKQDTNKTDTKEEENVSDENEETNEDQQSGSKSSEDEDSEDDDEESGDDEDSDDDEEDVEEEEMKEDAEVKKTKKSETEANNNQEENNAENEPEEGSCLFVKNLNFETTDNQLKEHFQDIGLLHSATVAKKKDFNRPGELLSMGYGFVQFMTQKDAKEALKMLQNSDLDGHKLELKLSTRTTPTVKGRNIQKLMKQPSTKILVRNIPWEATMREIRDLFKVFGEIKFVRLPKKMHGTGPHRGFAFVDFHTKDDAKRAFSALCHSTHLYGRRLVLEWAQTEESLDDLRRKTAQHFSDDGPPKKFSKTSLMKDLE